MKASYLWLGAVLLMVPAAMARDWLDQLGDRLSYVSPDGTLGLRVSGLLDVEGYAYDYPVPGLIDAEDRSLLNSRLTLFLDAQIGSRIYFFAQSRVDQGFDPADDGFEARLDEYALRFSLSPDARLNFQVGRFATVVGSWVRRHRSWENPFITAPLAYEHLTGVWDAAPARSSRILLNWAHLMPPFDPKGVDDKHLRLPLVWGPVYASGAALFGEFKRLDYALEIKNAAVSSRPESWGLDHDGWKYPSVNGRVGYRPNMMWDLGFSAGTGPYLKASAGPGLPDGFGLRDYRQIFTGQDISFAWHYWQLWFEAYQSRFEIPTVADADVVSWYVTAKYKFTPRFFCALRWNRQSYGDVPFGGGRRAWGRDVWRVDVAPTYRFTPHLQLKLQYSWQHEADAPDEQSHTVGAQLTARF